ncbi:glycosyltransferase family 87 protein [Acidicapsa acidisoli]|uniref:glycosyltransferase family 87 protein n=1 Tax=Acidicapsa acidisoli TaxID=1615681 RepID=UPI0021E05A5B|nr:glycosyltransferase family 87 protein [Acidicapsa acidisoli]
MGDTGRISVTDSNRRPLFQWPVKILGPAPGLKELNLACWGLFAGFLIAPLIFTLWLNHRIGSVLKSFQPVDFTYLYGVGRIVHEYSFARLYDYSLQLKIFNQIYPLSGEHTYGPSPYPPFVALFFCPFARLPFMQAYLIWVSISLILYLAGIAASVKGLFPKEGLKTSLIFCYALGFYPFCPSTIVNGQLSVVAVFSLGLAVYQERVARPFACGLALSLLAYKPTLLLLILPMLLITRRLRQFLGFITGSALLMLATTLFTGIEIWPTYLRFLNYFRQASVFEGQSRLQLNKYVDFTSFSYAVPGGRSRAAMIILIGLSSLILTALAVLLWKSARASTTVQPLVWAVTLTWTLLVNLYVPIYDSTVIVISLILTLATLRDLNWRREVEWTILLAVLIFAVSWNTVALAKSIEIQLITVLLAILGVCQSYWLYQVVRRASRRERQALAIQ